MMRLRKARNPSGQGRKGKFSACCARQMAKFGGVSDRLTVALCSNRS
jgi:hypothetical protein